MDVSNEYLSSTYAIGAKEYPEYVGHFLLEFLIKKIPLKNDQCIQRTP